MWLIYDIHLLVEVLSFDGSLGPAGTSLASPQTRTPFPFTSLLTVGRCEWKMLRALALLRTIRTFALSMHLSGERYLLLLCGKPLSQFCCHFSQRFDCIHRGSTRTRKPTCFSWRFSWNEARVTSYHFFAARRAAYEDLPLCFMAQHLRIGMDHCYASVPCMEICSYLFQVAVVTYLSKQ